MIFLTSEVIAMEGFVNVAAHLEEIDLYMPHFVFYRRGIRSPGIGVFGEYIGDEHNSKVTDCYCTACHERYEDDINSPKHYKHKKFGYCTHCRAPVEYRQMNYGRSTYYYTKNFAVFEGAGDRMHIECIKVSQKFDDEEENELQPVLDWYTVTRYELEPGRAIQYRLVWERPGYNWEPKKGKATEPNFALGCFGYGDRSYTLINHEAVSHSFLKYLFKDVENLPSLYIEWLCRYAEHHQLEYLMHGGLYQVAEQYVTKNLHGIRLNWRSNDLKKIVRLHKVEIEYLAKEDGLRYRDYIHWRKNTFEGKTPAETIKYYAEFHSCERYITEVQEITNLTTKKIMDYTLKRRNTEGPAFFLICWRDYLRDCIELKYDMQSESVIMPKGLFTLHERTQHILEGIRDAHMNDELQESDIKRKDLECVDMELGLALYLPRTVKDIATEGAELSHCVGGYAERHAKGKLTIMFLRTLRHPGKPYYTMEVSNDLEIVQCRGYRNNLAHNPKPDTIIEFERRYAEYLDYVKENRRKAKEKEARKKRQQTKAKTKAKVKAA